MAVPLLDKKIIKKRVKKFKRPQSDRFVSVKGRNEQENSSCDTDSFNYKLSVTIILFTYLNLIAHNISTKKRKEIVERAAQLDVVVTNKLARLRSQEDE